MKEELKKHYDWFMRLSLKHKVYFVYWGISFTLLLGGVNEYNPMWLCVLLVANFANSTRLLRHIPCDDLED